MYKNILENSKLFERLSKFALVGSLATIVFYLMLWSLVEWLHVPVLIATSIAFLAVTIENYLLHYGWTFASSNPHSIAFPRFLFMTFIGFWINWAVMFIGTQQPMNYLLVQAIAIVAVIIWNFSLCSLWIFSESKE